MAKSKQKKNRGGDRNVSAVSGAHGGNKDAFLDGQIADNVSEAVGSGIESGAVPGQGLLGTGDDDGLAALHEKAYGLLKECHGSVMELSQARLAAKMSNTRVTGVGRELKELIKVMSVYA